VEGEKRKIRACPTNCSRDPVQNHINILYLAFFPLKMLVIVK